MPITFPCPCGKILRVAEEHAGRRVKCPACNAVGTVPAPEVEPVFEVVEPAPRPTASKPRFEEEEEPRGVYGLAGKGRAKSEDEEETGAYGLARPGSGPIDHDDGPRDKPLPDFRLGSGQRGKKRNKGK